MSKAMLCPQCQHPITDYGTFDACTFCQFTRRKAIKVLDKEFDPFDFQALGDAIEYIYKRVETYVEHNHGIDPALFLKWMREIDRLRALQLNIAVNKADVATAFLKDYGPTMEAMKQILAEKDKK